MAGSERTPKTQPPPVDLARLADLDIERPIPGAEIPAGWGSYAHFRGLFEQSPVAMSLIDLATRTALPNPAFLRLFGFDQAGARPYDAITITHPEHRVDSHQKYAAMIRGEIPSLSLDRHQVKADFTDLWSHIEATLLRDAQGQPWAVLTVVQDLTDRMAAERALAESEARFRALVQNASDAIVVLDADANLTYATPSAAELVGVSLEDRLGRSVLDLVHPGDVEVATEALANTVLRPGVAVPLRMRLRRSDGAERFVEAVASNLLHDEAVGGIVINLRDLTDRERVETALEVSESRFRRMLENISDTVALLEGDGSIIATTGNVRAVMGYPTEYWTSRSGFDLIHPDDVDTMQRLLAEVLANPGREVHGEFRSRTVEGDYIDVEGTGVNLLDDPTVSAIVITTRNISDRKAAERELAAARDAALRELATRTEFIASVGHELRTPIHGVLGLAELLATSGLDDEAASLALAITRATRHLEEVLDDLLDYSKIEAGRLELTRAPVEVAALLDEVLVLYGMAASSKGVGLRSTVTADVPPVVAGDAFRLRQVLGNLVSNAVKFTQVGEVVVDVSLVPSPTEPLVSLVRIAVRDTGIGIPEAAQAHLFEAFSQAFTSTAREFGGTGLGLTIARRLAALMGGSLDVRSEPGRGSEFAFVLPLDPAELEDQPTVVVPTSSLTGSARRVLVVDDNPVNQLLMRHQLERLGFDPTVVASGGEAIDRFTEVRPDVVLMDCQMPGLDGFATTRALRRVERRSASAPVPIVAVTANALPGERARCIEAGMDEVLTKPVGLHQLGGTLARWLGDPDGPGPEAEAQTSDDADAVDVTVLDRLADELGDRTVVERVVGVFRAELPTRLAAMDRAVADGDDGSVRATAHTLCSTSATVGATRLAAWCRSIEVGPPGAARDLAGTLARLAVEAPHVDRALAAWVAGSSAPRGGVATDSR